MKKKKSPPAIKAGPIRRAKPGLDFSIPIWLGIIIALTAFSSFLFGFYYLHTGTLFNDNLNAFGSIRDNLQSINQFGEFSWWFPQSQFGWPAYYLSLLGCLPLTNPVLSFLVIVFWLLGRFGIHVNSYLPVYVFYFAFLQPLVLTLSVFTFVRQFYRRRLGLLAVIILTAFSPAAVNEMQSLGIIEPTAYFLFFCAAMLYFLKQPNKTSFLAVCVTILANALIVGYGFLLWNALAIPLFMALLFFFPVSHFRRLKAALVRIPVKFYCLGGLLLLICVAPVLIAYSQTGDLVRTKIGSTTYEVDQLRTGNPIEFLIVSLPGAGMQWLPIPDHPESWTAWSLVWPEVPINIKGSSVIVLKTTCYCYMGIPTLALSIFGLICGKMMIRRRLVLLLIVLGGLVCLSRSSPFMALLFSLPSPLRANDHFSDGWFRVGGFLFFVFSAVNGLHALIYGTRRARILFAILFVTSLLVALGVYVEMSGVKVAGNTTFSFFAVMGLIYLVPVISLCAAKTIGSASRLVGLIVFCLLVDTSTFSYLHLQHDLPQASVVDETPAQDNIGLRSDSLPTDGFLSYKSLLDLSKNQINVNAFQPLKAFARAHVLESLQAEHNVLAAAGNFDQYNSLGLQVTNPAASELAEFFKTEGTPGNPKINITSSSRTYNQLVFQMNASQKCLFFVRDAYSPYWHVWVNGEEKKIYRALSNFKCVVVPEGNSTVIFKFSPPGIHWLLPLALLVFWSALLLLCYRLCLDRPWQSLAGLTDTRWGGRRAVILKLLTMSFLVFVICLLAWIYYAVAGNRNPTEQILSVADLESKAQTGDAQAEFLLAKHYLAGEGVAANPTNAFQWFSKAAEQGLAEAQCQLGMRYFQGEGVAKDFAASIPWFRKAADQGNADAQYNLGLLYENGLGVKKDLTEAALWYQRAAEKGHILAQNNLGLICFNIKTNYVEAEKWFRKAAEQGNALAQNSLGVLYLQGLGVKQDANEAIKWFQGSAQQGLAEGQNNCGLVFFGGQHFNEAAQWFHNAAEQGHAGAQYNLAQFYQKGLVYPQDLGEATLWYSRSAKQGYGLAQLALGKIYHEGQGVKADNLEAYKWFKLAQLQGVPDAQKELTNCAAAMSKEQLNAAENEINQPQK